MTMCPVSDFRRAGVGAALAGGSPGVVAGGAAMKAAAAGGHRMAISVILPTSRFSSVKDISVM